MCARVVEIKQNVQCCEERETDITTTSHTVRTLGTYSKSAFSRSTDGCKYRQPTVGVSTVLKYDDRVHVAGMVVLMALVSTILDEHTARLSL